MFSDHSKIYYRPFKKNFYVQVPEITRMTNEGKLTKLRDQTSKNVK